MDHLLLFQIWMVSFFKNIFPFHFNVQSIFLIITCVKIGAFFERDLESFFNENFFKKTRIAIESNFEKDAFGGVPESHYGEKCFFFSTPSLTIQFSQESQ